MPKLAIVTYLRDQEELTPELISIGNQLQKYYADLVMELYVESEALMPIPHSNFPVRITYLKGTKYRKLLHALQNTDYSYLLSLDNDIAANLSGLQRLVAQTMEGGFSIGWGKIHSRKVSNIVSRLVEVDKLLSHNVLRPALWHFHLGVTIPGQCFIIKTVDFRNRLPSTDTFLDDLSIGLYAAKYRLRYNYSKEIVAFELPSYSFKSLWKQRLRWATGFRQSLYCNTLTTQDRQLLWIHAICYHLLPILHVIAMTILALKAPLISIIWLVMISLFTVRNRPKALGAALIYLILFPLFHLGWWFQFFRVKL